MSNPQISAHEQLMLELINRARLDPQGEADRHGISLNAGLASGTLSAAARAPLAWDGNLGQSAARHADWMLSADTFSHTGAGGSSSTERILDAGYRLAGGWSTGENISWRGTTDGVNQTSSILEQHEALFRSAGHRENILGNFREAGVAQEMGRFSSYDASMVAVNFAKTGTQAFITGVAYSDGDADRFYDIGSGREGVIFDRLDRAGNGVETGHTGGYALAIPTGLSGWEDIAVRSGGDTRVVSLRMTGTNVKLDLAGQVLASSTDMDLGRGANQGRALGSGNIDIAGNGADNKLWGGSGSNVLRGLDGNDLLWGRDGSDRLEGGSGSDNLIGGLGNDILLGGGGADRFVFVDPPGARTGHDQINDLGQGDRIVVDLSGPLPIERVWEDNHIDRVAGGWKISLPDSSSITVWDATLSEVENALRLA